MNDNDLLLLFTYIIVAKLHVAEREYRNSNVFSNIVKIFFSSFVISDTFKGQVKVKGTPAANYITICLIKSVSIAAGGRKILDEP